MVSEDWTRSSESLLCRPDGTHRPREDRVARRRPYLGPREAATWRSSQDLTHVWTFATGRCIGATLSDESRSPRSRGAVGARRSRRLLSLRDTARAMSQENVEIVAGDACDAWNRGDYGCGFRDVRSRCRIGDVRRASARWRGRSTGLGDVASLGGIGETLGIPARRAGRIIERVIGEQVLVARASRARRGRQGGWRSRRSISHRSSDLPGLDCRQGGEDRPRSRRLRSKTLTPTLSRGILGGRCRRRTWRL